MSDVNGTDSKTPARTYRFPDDLVEWLDARAKQMFRTRNSLVLEAVLMYRSLTMSDAKELGQRLTAATDVLAGQLSFEDRQTAVVKDVKAKRKSKSKPARKPARRGKKP